MMGELGKSKIAYEISKEVEKYLKPKVLQHSDHICYWAEKEGILLGGMKSKVRKFLDEGCIKATDKPNIFHCLPLPDYNKTTHIIDISIPSCSCQANKRNGIICSHILSVRTFLFKERWNSGNKDY